MSNLIYKIYKLLTIWVFLNSNNLALNCFVCIIISYNLFSIDLDIKYFTGAGSQEQEGGKVYNKLYRFMRQR
jgi:hypothetical protein